MRGMASLAALVVLSPLVFAYPTSTTWGDYEGVAVQGSRDESDDWPWRQNLECSQALEDFILTLYVDEGADTDVLVLEAPVGVPRNGALPLLPWLALEARVGQPATIYSSQNDGCPEFAVVGHDVATEARYHVTVERCVAGVDAFCL